MSLILEALKKSEQQRRLGEAPTLGSPVLVVRRRRSLLPLFGLLIAGALGAGWWLTRTPAADPSPAASPPSVTSAPPPSVPPTAAPPATAAARAPVRTPAPASADAAQAAATERALAIDARQVQLPDPAAGPASERPGGVALPPPSPLTGGPRDLASTAAVATAPAAIAPGTRMASAAAAPQQAPTPAPAKAAPPAATPTPPPAAPTAAPAPAPVAPAPTPAPAPPTTPPAPTQAPVATTPPPTPAAPTLPTLWELPYATRKDVPPLALTMHVYAAEPSERFVVVRGDRHVEGDDLGDGVTLRQITPDGMVLEFKGQRFRYPRDGR